MADAFGMGTAYANGNNYLQAQVSTAVPGSTAAPGVSSVELFLGLCLGLGPGSTAPTWRASRSYERACTSLEQL